jgi:tRNA 2-thiouridine synthesizing protein A
MHDNAVTPRETLDLRGLKCPLPVLRTRRVLDRLAPREVIAVLCTDPLAGIDVPNLLRETGDSLLEAERAGKEWRFLIRKG